jgi:hypothetical protein
VQFEVPLTNTPLRSKPERAHLRLLDSPYNMNAGPICDDACAHYQRVCMCYLQENAGFPDEDVEPIDFAYSGAVHFAGDDDTGEVAPWPAQNICGKTKYGVSL